MKKTYITLLLFFLSASMTIAQTKSTQKADKLFNRFEYVSAAKEYEKLAIQEQADGYVYKQLADCYYHQFNTREAAKWYAKAVETAQEAETHYRYAQMLKADGNYEAANEQMKKFAQLAPSDSRAKAYASNPNYLPSLNSQTKLFDATKLDINSDKSDFGAMLTHTDELYFASARNTARKSYAWNKEPYLDVYKSIHNSGTFSEPTLVESINTKFHEGPVTLSADGNTMYYSSESYNEDSYEKDKSLNARFGQVNLFKATKDGNGWANSTPLPFNSSQYSTSNPSLCKAGKTLFFTSNMPGGKGGNDIWKVAVNADGTFGAPENLGDPINTAGNESFPFIADDGKLYFSSDARQGFGGLDIYVIDLKNKGEAKNVGKPVNSEKDDFAFTMNIDKNVGFFASNREGNDDMYKAIPVCGVELIAMAKDTKTNAPISDVKVSLIDAKGTNLGTRNTNVTGSTNFAVECNKNYSLQVSREGYESNTFTVAGKNGGKIEVETNLKPIEIIITEKEIILNPIYFEYDKSDVTLQGAEILDGLVAVMNEKPELTIFVKSHTDNRGEDKYNLRLSERRNQATVAYIIAKGINKDRVSGQGYGESEPKINCQDACTEEEHAQNRRSEFLIVKK